MRVQDFTFENKTRFHFGKKQLQKLDDELLGSKMVMMVFGEDPDAESELRDRITGIVEGTGAQVVNFGGVGQNPTWAMVEEGAELAKDKGVDFILGVGGDPVMSCAKAIALAAVQDKAWKKHWVRFDPIVADPIPLGFVVTCPGSGTEGNGLALITNTKTKMTTGKDYPELQARFAILEPELTFDLPREQTIAGAYATLSALMETYFSEPMGNIIPDSMLETAMRSVMRSLEVVLENPNDYNARCNLMWISTLAGGKMLQCGKDGIFQCHMISRQIRAYTGCSEGEALAAVQAKYLRFVKTTSVLITFQLKRFAMNIFGIPGQDRPDIDVALDGLDALEAWTKKVGAGKTLTELGVTTEAIGKIGKSTTIIPMKYCKLNSDDIEILLEQCQ